MSATTELIDDKKISMSIDNIHRVKNHLYTCSSKHSWGLLLGKVTESSGETRDVIRNYKNVLTDNELAFTNTFLENRRTEAPPKNRNMECLNPATTPEVSMIEHVQN